MNSIPLLPPPSASFLPISPDRREPPKGDKMVFGSAQKAIKGSTKLLRLMALDRALPGNAQERQQELQALATVWSEAQQKLRTSFQAAKESVQSGLAKLGPKISSIYLPAFESDVDIGGKIMKFLKDPLSVSISPLRRSARGVRGPTFLVDYATSKQMRSFVVKWSDLNEQVSNRLYHQFSNCFTDKSVSCGFSVPPSSRFDFAAQIHETTSGEMQKLQADISDTVQANFFNLAKTFDQTLTPDTRHIMLAERISGQNLMDFAYTNYKNLTAEQKAKFFERLGRLAFLDLLTGNLDRLVHPSTAYTDDGSYTLDPLEVNLGNVMVHPLDSEGNFHLYAIDNGINQELVDNPDARKKYATFLSDLFSKPDPFTPLITNIIESFHSAFEAQVDDIDTVESKSESEAGPTVNLQIVRENLKPFIRDLKELAPAALHLGLSKMANWLANEALPKHWDRSPQGAKLQKYLAHVHPEYLSSINERFNIFLTSRAK